MHYLSKIVILISIISLPSCQSRHGSRIFPSINELLTKPWTVIESNEDDDGRKHEVIIDTKGNVFERAWRSTGSKLGCRFYPSGSSIAECWMRHTTGEPESHGFLGRDKHTNKPLTYKEVRMSPSVAHVGEWTWWAKDGRQLAKGTYRNQKPWQGSFVTTYTQPTQIESYHDGMKHGLWHGLSQNYEIIVSGEYNNGIPMNGTFLIPTVSPYNKDAKAFIIKCYKNGSEAVFPFNLYCYSDGKDWSLHKHTPPETTTIGMGLMKLAEFVIRENDITHIDVEVLAEFINKYDTGYYASVREIKNQK